jgi:hypothetical protein
MQNAASDPHFAHTVHWLNNAKGIGRTLPRSAQQVKSRYALLCANGRKDQRLKDQNVIRTITKLKKSMKQLKLSANVSAATGQAAGVMIATETAPAGGMMNGGTVIMPSYAIDGTQVEMISNSNIYRTTAS